MATATTVTNRCIKCDKQNAILKCGGCLKDFCYNHVLEHRQELNKQLDEVEINRDLMRQSLNEQTTEPKKHPLIQQVDQWEYESINKIKQTAEETRKLLLNYTGKHIHRIESKLNNLTSRLKQGREENDFVETNLNEWNKQLIELKEELNKPSNIKISYDSTPLVTQIYADVPMQVRVPNINTNAKWMQTGVTVAGGNGLGNGLDQLSSPWGMHINKDQTIYVADYSNHRIVEWKNGVTSGQVVAGGNGQGNRNDQLNWPVNVILDKRNDCLIICDYGNRRVVRWHRGSSTNGETIIANISCWDLTIDNDGQLYTCDYDKHEVRRWQIGETNGTVVAGGHGPGNRLNQLRGPCYIFIDQHHSVYVSEYHNHRVIKWAQDATEGVVVAGGQGQGNSLTKLSAPYGIAVDQLGTVYVADCDNQRVMRWLKGATQGSVVVGGNGVGEQGNQFSSLCDLSFDRENNLYVVDRSNHRVQKFHIEPNSNS